MIYSEIPLILGNFPKIALLKERGKGIKYVIFSYFITRI